MVDCSVSTVSIFSDDKVYNSYKSKNDINLRKRFLNIKVKYVDFLRNLNILTIPNWEYLVILGDFH